MKHTNLPPIRMNSFSYRRYLPKISNRSSDINTTKLFYVWNPNQEFEMNYQLLRQQEELQKDLEEVLKQQEELRKKKSQILKKQQVLYHKIFRNPKIQKDLNITDLRLLTKFINTNFFRLSEKTGFPINSKDNTSCTPNAVAAFYLLTNSLVKYGGFGGKKNLKMAENGKELLKILTEMKNGQVIIIFLHGNSGSGGHCFVAMKFWHIPRFCIVQSWAKISPLEVYCNMDLNWLGKIRFGDSIGFKDFAIKYDGKLNPDIFDAEFKISEILFSETTFLDLHPCYKEILQKREKPKHINFPSFKDR